MPEANIKQGRHPDVNKALFYVENLQQGFTGCAGCILNRIKVCNGGSTRYQPQIELPATEVSKYTIGELSNQASCISS